MEVAKKVFAAHGYHKTNIEMICKRAGTSRGTIYRYFKNKEDIFTVILKKSDEEMNQQLVGGYDFSQVSLKSREEIMESYLETVERLFVFLVSDRDFTRIALEVSTGVNKRFSQIRMEHERRNVALIKAMMDKWKDNNIIRREIDTELAAIRLRGSLEKIARTFILDQKQKLSQEEIKILVRKNAVLDLYGWLTPQPTAINPM